MYAIQQILEPATQNSKLKRFVWTAWTLDAAGKKEIQFRGNSTIDLENGCSFAEAYAEPTTMEQSRNPEWFEKTAPLEIDVAAYVTERISQSLDGSVPELRDRMTTIDDEDFKEFSC
jgi:hypothetical protein